MTLEFFPNHPFLIGGLVAFALLLFSWRAVLWVFGIIIVPDDSIGTVTKKFVLFGSHRNLPDGQIVALEGEAGYQADTLSPGLHMGLWPWQYEIDLIKFIFIPQGKIGVVQACDGRPLPSGRIIARDIDCNVFQDARAFLKNGGERGPQMKVVPPGTYRLQLSVTAPVQRNGGTLHAPVASVEQEITVPPRAPGEADEPMDVGVLELKEIPKANRLSGWKWGLSNRCRSSVAGSVWRKTPVSTFARRRSSSSPAG